MINLLPPYQKRELHQHRTRRLVVVLGIIGTVFLVALTLVLLSLQIYLSGQIEYQSSLVEIKESKTKPGEISPIQSKFENFNQQLIQLEQFYQNQQRPSRLFKQFKDILPAEVYLNSISHQRLYDENYEAHVVISGWAPSTEALVQLSDAMIDKPTWEQVKVPRSNWMKATNIDFKVSFEIKDETKE